MINILVETKTYQINLDALLDLLLTTLVHARIWPAIFTTSTKFSKPPKKYITKGDTSLLINLECRLGTYTYVTLLVIIIYTVASNIVSGWTYSTAVSSLWDGVFCGLLYVTANNDTYKRKKYYLK